MRTESEILWFNLSDANNELVRNNNELMQEIKEAMQEYAKEFHKQQLEDKNFINKVHIESIVYFVYREVVKGNSVHDTLKNFNNVFLPTITKV